MTGSSGSAFGGLLGTFGSADAAGGGPDAAAGGAAGEGPNKPQLPLRPPPQPCLPTRMPRKTFRQVWAASPGNSWDSSSVSSSDSCSPMGLGSSPRQEDLASAMVAAAALLAGQQPSYSAARARATEGGGAGGLDAPGADAPGGTSPASAADSAAAPPPAPEEETPRAKILSDFTDYCCFRDGRKPHRSSSGGGSATKSRCPSIREDRPETAFRGDEEMLKLRSLLRKHRVEPTETLVGDLLRWQAREARGSPMAGSGQE